MNSRLTLLVLFLPFLYLHIAFMHPARVENAGNQKASSSVESDSLTQIITSLMEKHHIPGVSILSINNGEIANEITIGIKQAKTDQLIDSSTMFSVGSISKVVNAVLVLKLVKEGKLDLDSDVNEYLTTWKVPLSKMTQDQPVTLRRILSHTAGFSVHGFADYQPGEKLPTTLQILNGSGPAKNRKVKVIFPVGSKFKYSGGGTTVSQLLVEEVTGLPYAEAAETHLIKPLGLNRSTYQNPLPSSYDNIAKAHGKRGQIRALPRAYEAMPEQAASGLWTTPRDLFAILKSLFESEHQDGLLNPELVSDMISKEENTAFGLGPKTTNRDGRLIIHHNGANDSYRAHWKVFWDDKSGYIIFTNGSNGSDLINELNPILDEFIKQ